MKNKSKNKKKCKKEVGINCIYIFLTLCIIKIRIK